jgi:arylsulfatase A-like enzyme
MQDVVLISLDCVRPEALTCFPGRFNFYETVPVRASTPNIDAIADESLIFTNAFCQAPFTPASHASVFTGTNPYQHGIRSMFGCELRDNLLPIAELFRDAGYDTAGFIGAHALSTEYGLDRGFETYDDQFNDGHNNWIVGNRRPGSEVTAKAIEWVDRHTNPAFLFLHYFDAHDGGGTNDDSDAIKPNASSNKKNEIPLHFELYDRFLRGIDETMGSRGKKLYKSWADFRDDSPRGRRYHLKQVQKIDEQIGRVTDALKSQGRYEDATIVLFADHGDAFGEHGETGHREYLYDTTLRVPLIIKPPSGVGLNGSVHDEVVRLIDVFPTLTALAELDSSQSEGKNLLKYVQTDVDELLAYAETRCEESPVSLATPKTDFVSLRTSSWKLIVDQKTDCRELYDVSTDLRELNDISDRHESVVDELTERLNSMMEGSPDKMEDIDISRAESAVIDQLEGLGYV